MRANNKFRLKPTLRERGRLVRTVRVAVFAGEPRTLRLLPVEWQDCAWTPHIGAVAAARERAADLGAGIWPCADETRPQDCPKRERFWRTPSRRIIFSNL